MTFLAVVVVFAVGLAAGLLSGLVGIGGGVLMVPFLYLFFAHPALAGLRLPPEVATVAAHATSLFVILPTSLRGAWSHHRTGGVVWRAVWPIGAAAAVAAVAAAQAATLLPPQLLRLAFAGVLLFSAVTLWRRKEARDEAGNPLPAGEPRLTLPITLGTGAAVGFFSALLGVGGGIVAIPLLLWLVRLDMRRVAGTSIGIITLTSAAGAVAYMVSAPETALRGGGWSLGYVDLAAGVALAAGALTSVAWGAKLNQRLDARTLSRMFAVLFLLIALELIHANLPFR